MTKLEMIEGCRFESVADGEFEVLTIRLPASGNDPVMAVGNDARKMFSDFLLACADGILTGLVPRNELWKKAEELAVKMDAEYRRLRS